MHLIAKSAYSLPKKATRKNYESKVLLSGKYIVSWRKAMKKSNTSRPVSELVQEVLDTISLPYPEDITDQVCLAIEGNTGWIKRYKSLVDSHSPKAVNSQIGRSTLQITGLRNLGLRAKATSSLIKTYTRLG